MDESSQENKGVFVAVTGRRTPSVWVRDLCYIAATNEHHKRARGRTGSATDCCCYWQENSR